MTTAPHATRTPLDCCVDFARAATASRRTVLQGALGLGTGLAATQLIGDSMLQASFAGAKGGSVLVVLSLRGGIDGLGAVVPHGDPGYYKVRPTTAVPKDQVVCADAMFGLHPKLKPLEGLWNGGRLAAIQAVGLRVANRSHFSAMEEVEDAAPGSDVRSGWINRMIGTAKTSNAASANGGIMDAVQLGQPSPTTALMGPAPVLTAANLDSLQVGFTEGDYKDPRYKSLATAWSGATGPLARAASEAVTVSQTTGGKVAASASTAAYPTEWNASPFAGPLKSAAGLIRADVGTDVIAIDAGAWDYHNNYGTTSWGSMQSSLDGLGKSIAAFFSDLGALGNRVTLVTISEFGRRVQENGSQGFDHGWGNMMLVAGAGVKGGKYYGSWPTLDAAALAEGDLKVTTDYRSVLWEIVGNRFPDRSQTALFPGFTTPQRLGFMA